MSAHAQDVAAIFAPLEFNTSLGKVKNRIFRSSISGTFDDYDGNGTQARINWETRFALGGVGAIISSFVPVMASGRILPRYAMIDDEGKIPFWTRVGEAVHGAHPEGCKFVLQLSHSGRQQDVGGVEFMHRRVVSSTDRKDYFHGILCRAATRSEIAQIVDAFGQGARRAQAAGLDGVELHGANGYLLTQFLSSGINDRRDEYGGSVRNRARFVLEIVRAIREACGRHFHLQMKINAVDENRWLWPLYHEHRGNRLEDTLEICAILEDGGDGVDAFHISSGSTFPHPRNPPGTFPMADAVRWYDGMLSQGVRTRFNHLVFRTPVVNSLFRRFWEHRRGPVIEGINLAYARRIRAQVSVPVMVTGGFQHANVIGKALRDGDCDAVTIARPLIRDAHLPDVLRRQNGPDEGEECTYCNKCLLNDLENPLGCYELDRFPGKTDEERYEKMMESVMSVFDPPTFGGS